jgi:hypothetical protein
MEQRKHSALKALVATLLSALLALALLGGTVSANAATCPNEAIRASQTSEAFPAGTTELPACMALEMVSPPKKLGQETLTLNAFSADGNRALFVSKAALAGTQSLQFFGGDSYVASREGGGWSVSPTSPPASADISAGGEKGGGPYAFGPNLDSWALLGATQAQYFGGKAQLFSGALGGGFAPLSSLLAPIDDSGLEELNLIFGSSGFFSSGSAADLSATAFGTTRPTTALLPKDPRDIGGGDTNSYLAFRDASGDPTVQLLARDEAGKAWGGRCGSFLGGEGGGLNQGAISSDGSRVFFSARPAQPFEDSKAGHPEGNPPCDTANPLRILLRTGEGPTIEELLPGEPTTPGDDLYQAASVDGSEALFASPRTLAASDEDTSSEACGPDLGASKGCDLYLYDSDLPPGSRLIQASAGEDVPGKHEAGKGADVLSSITATSADGSHAYFAAQGVLTADASPQGKAAIAGQPNLYLYARDAAHPSGELSFIATLAAGDKGTLWGGEQSFANGAYPVPMLSSDPTLGGDGHTLLFLSKAQLTSEDLDGTHTDAYRYDSEAGALACVSCAPGGDSAPFDAFAGSVEKAPNANSAEEGRWASEDGQTVAFATGAPLVEGDEDSAVNPYLWREGQPVRLPGTITDPIRPYKFPTVSPDGQVGFTTTEALLPQDGDGTRDAYVLRADGGFPNPPPPPTPCDPLSEGACQGPATIDASRRTPATPSFAGAGNQKAPARCRKGQVRKRGSCVKQSKKPKQSKKRGNDKRGGKK